MKSLSFFDFNKGADFWLTFYSKLDPAVHSSAEPLSADEVGDALFFVTKCICAKELTTAVEEMFSLSTRMGFDLMRHIGLKLKYNKTLARLHGKKY